MIPLLPFYAEKLGASATEVGWLIGVYALCQLFSGPLLGRMSDYTGRKPLLLVSQVGTLIGFLILAFAPNLVDRVSGAGDRRSDGGKSFARASLYLRRHATGGSGEIVRGDRHRVRDGVSDRSGDFGIPCEVRLSRSDFRGRGAFGHQHSGDVAASSVGEDQRESSGRVPADGGYRCCNGANIDAISSGRNWPGGCVNLLRFGFPFAMFTAGFPLFAERRLSGTA